MSALTTVRACCAVDPALFYGRSRIAGVEPGSRIRLHGTVRVSADGHLAMINPAYELLA
jgi:hypothetical protein